jgi:hypothetical protein
LTFCTADTTTYATGSKDTLGIGNGGWQCNADNNVNSKIDIMNAYSASYFTGPNKTGDHILYFGMEKNKDNGTNDIGVWFLQSGAACTAPATGAVNFTGQHQNKDVLVVSEFSNGGGVSSIQAFQWAAAASGPLSTRTTTPTRTLAAAISCPSPRATRTARPQAAVIRSARRPMPTARRGPRDPPAPCRGTTRWRRRG